MKTELAKVFSKAVEQGDLDALPVIADLLVDCGREEEAKVVRGLKHQIEHDIGNGCLDLLGLNETRWGGLKRQQGEHTERFDYHQIVVYQNTGVIGIQAQRGNGSGSKGPSEKGWWSMSPLFMRRTEKTVRKGVEDVVLCLLGVWLDLLVTTTAENGLWTAPRKNRAKSVVDQRAMYEDWVRLRSAYLHPEVEAAVMGFRSESSFADHMKRELIPWWTTCK